MISWFLRGPIISKLEEVCNSFFLKIETTTENLLNQHFTVTASPSAFEIFEQQLASNELSLNLEERKKLFQNRLDFFKKIGTLEALSFVKIIFQLDTFKSEVMRESGLTSLYSYITIKFWFSKANADDQLKTRISKLLKYILPAKCTKHFILEYDYSESGFGVTSFGNKFGL